MDKRTLLTVGLSLAILFVWMYVIVPWVWPPQPALPPRPVPTAPAPIPVVPPPAPVAAPQGDLPKHEVLPPTILKGPFFDVAFTNEGAGIRSLALHYPGPENSVPLLGDQDRRWPHLAIRHVGGPDPIESLPWKLEEQTPGSIRYSLELRNGMEISKTFTLDPAKHTLKMALSLKSVRPGGEETIKLEILAFNGIDPDSPFRHEIYLMGVAFADGRIQRWSLQQVAEGGAVRDPAEAAKRLELAGGGKDWFGIKSRFFTVLLAPEGEARPLVDAYAFHPAPREAVERFHGVANFNASARTGTIRVGAQPVAFEFTAFFGPVKSDVLKDLRGAPDLLDYGGGCAGGCFLAFFLSPIVYLINHVAPAILWIMNLFGTFFGNYGLGIMLTTIVIRICLFPLTKKSQVSMFRMSQLQPKVKVLRERYKDDQQKFGTEQMKLFREHKINPLSGCLPIFFQLPIFVGMFSVFDLSIELREAPFMLWITDLSQPDRLLTWDPVSIPLFVTTLVLDGLNLLPLLMTITWFLQSYFAPRSPDPQMQAQQKMFLFMPIFFGLVCYNYASGLSLYFLVNSLLAMGEQKLVKKLFIKPMEGGAVS